jgi:hypothetical protein
VSFAVITFCVASQRVFVVVYFVIDQSGNFRIHPRKDLQILRRTLNSSRTGPHELLTNAPEMSTAFH